MNRSGAALAAALSLAATAFCPLAARADDGGVSCGDILIVLDRSGSMANCMVDGMAKEVIAKAAIKELTTKFPTTPMGLFVFPDTVSDCLGAACAKGKMIIDVADDSPPKIASWLDTMPVSCGGTPTGDSMLEVAKYDKWATAKNHYVLIITDGQPTCQDGDDGMMPPMMCDGMGSVECANPTKVYDAIKDLHSRSIDTFVIGFAGMAGGGVCTGVMGLPFNADTLNKMAEYGGQALTVPPAKYEFYVATDGKTLAEALDKILGTVAGGTVMGCSIGDAGMGGMGGGSDGDSGAGGAAGGGQGGAAGGGQGGAVDAGTRPAHGTSGSCGCRLGDTSPSVALAGTTALVVGLALALRARRRRRG